jgi:hypothetical protein
MDEQDAVPSGLLQPGWVEAVNHTGRPEPVIPVVVFLQPDWPADEPDDETDE